MAKAPDPFHEFVAELFHGLGPVTIKRMFGGAGVWQDGVMFALLADDTIFLKADPALRAALTEEGSYPFVWERPSDSKQIDLGYVSLPSSALDDADEAVTWGRKALGVAREAKLKAPPPRKRKKV
ncbi:MAG: TfoX/Sxy family protein [Acidobacteria bacterium]|jgi:DNA transformation protein|nr:TfoX/Sxy family protein [Acidobacteriota bacterium]